MKTTLLLIIVCSQLSCSNKSKLENIFITTEKEYWSYKDNCGSYGVFFKFNKDGTYDKYNRYIDDGFTLFNNDGDIISGSRNWSVNDSTFLWNKFEYKIKICEPKRIVLVSKNGKCEKTFLKTIDEKK